MAAPTSAYTYQSYLQAAAMEVGYSLDDAELTADQLLQLDTIINQAVTEYYNTTAWSFLIRQGSFTTVVGTPEYDCPDDFGYPLTGKAGEITFQETPAQYWKPVQFVPEHQIREALQMGRQWLMAPAIYTTRNKNNAGATFQQQEFVLFPNPSQVWTMYFNYRIQPQALTAANPYPMGGSVHAKAIMDLIRAQACLSISRDESRYKQYSQKYADQLAFNITNDGMNKAAAMPGHGGMQCGRRRYNYGINGRTFGDGWPQPYIGPVTGP